MMIPMTQEFVSEINDGETKLNEEIDDLLNGIDFQQSMSQEKSPNYIPSTFPEQNGTFNIQESFLQSQSKENSPNSIPSTYPEENGLKMEYEDIGSPLLFTQKEKEEEKEEQKQVPMEINQPVKPLNIMDIGISDEEDSDQDPVIISDTPKEDVKQQKQIQIGLTQPLIPINIGMFSEENGNDQDPVIITDTSQENVVQVIQSAPILQPFTSSLGKSSVSAPILQPFNCSQEKTPLPQQHPMDTLEETKNGEQKSILHYEDPMDTLEEVPVRDVGDTYLSEDELNMKYPKDDNNQAQQGEERIDTVPYVMNYHELGVFLDNQEKIGKVIKQNNNVEEMEMDNNVQGMKDDNNLQEMEMDNFILGEVLNPNSGPAAVPAVVPVAASAAPASVPVTASVTESEAMEVQVQVATNQSNQVCLF